MAKLVVLWSADASIRIGQTEASGLAKLGISSIALLRDDSRVGVVLEGWAFDPTRSGDDAVATLCADPPLARLLPVVEIGMANAMMQGESDVPNPTRPGRHRGRHGTAGA